MFTEWLRLQPFRLPQTPSVPPPSILPPDLQLDNSDCSGIHILPDDVLQELFEWIVRDTPPAHSVINSPTVTPAQLTLASVCSRWRGLVTSISYFWNEITLDCAHFERVRLPYWRLVAYLRWSRGLSISLHLNSVDSPKLYLNQTLENRHGQLLDILTPYRHRWKSLTLVLDHELAGRLLPINPLSVENFESLRVDFRTRYWFDEDPHQIPASLVAHIVRFPNIKHLDFRSCSPWSYIPDHNESKHWEKLKHLSVHVTYGLPHLIGMKMMQYLTSAEYIRLNIYVHRRRADGMTREVLTAANHMRKSLPEQFVLPQLRELILSVDHDIETDERVLEMIVAPNLEALSLSLHPVSEYDGRVLLREAGRLVERASGLKSIYLLLCGSQYIEADDVAGFIWGCYKHVPKIEIAGDRVYVIPALERWVASDPGLSSVVSFIATEGISKFEYFR